MNTCEKILAILISFIEICTRHSHNCYQAYPGNLYH